MTIGRLNSYLKTLRERVGLGHSHMWNALKAKKAIEELEVKIDPGELDALKAKASEHYILERDERARARKEHSTPKPPVATSSAPVTRSTAVPVPSTAALEAKISDLTAKVTSLTKALEGEKPQTFGEHVRFQMKAQGISKGTAIGYCVKKFPAEYAIYRAAQDTGTAEEI